MTTVYFKLSTEGIKKEMLKGVSAKEKNSVEIDLSKMSAEDRELLIKHSGVSQDSLCIGKYAYRSRSSSSSDGWEWNHFYSLDSSDIIDGLKSIEAREQEKLKQQQEADRKRAEQEKIESENKERTRKENRNKYLNNKEAALKFTLSYNGKQYYPELDNDTYDYILKAKLDENKAQKAAIEAAKEELRLWALMNGSELLQLRIEENMNWYQLANDEYFKSIMPDGFTELDQPEDSWEIKNAELNQIKTLREVKKTHPEAKLMRYKYELVSDEDYEGEDEDERYEHKNVIQITLKSISGEEKTFEKEL